MPPSTSFTRALIVLSTAGLCGFWVGAGLAQLSVPVVMTSTPVALPTVEVIDGPPTDVLAGGLFAPVDPPPPPGSRDAGAGCEVPWRLVGTMLDRRQPTRSFAAIHMPDGPRLMASSMSHQELTLVSLEAQSVTLQDQDGMRCELRMFSRETIVSERPVETGVPSVRRVSATRVELDRGLLTRLDELRVRVVPQFVGGRVEGVQLSGIPPTSPLAAAGLVNGDRITHVDGLRLAGPDIALGALGRLQSGNPVRLTVESRGHSREVTLILSGA